MKEANSAKNERGVLRTDPMWPDNLRRPSVNAADAMKQDPRFATKLKSSTWGAGRDKLGDPGIPKKCSVYRYQRMFHKEWASNTEHLCTKESERFGCGACMLRTLEIREDARLAKLGLRIIPTTTYQ